MTERLTAEQSIRLYAEQTTQEIKVKNIFDQIENLFRKYDIPIDNEHSNCWIDNHVNPNTHLSFPSIIGSTRYILFKDSYISQAQHIIEKTYQTPAAFCFSYPPSSDPLFSLPIANYPSQGYAQVMPSHFQEELINTSSDEIIYARLYTTHILVNPREKCEIIELQLTSTGEWKKIEFFNRMQEKDEKNLYNKDII